MGDAAPKSFSGCDFVLTNLRLTSARGYISAQCVYLVIFIDSWRPRIVLSRLFVVKPSLKSVVVFVSVPDRLEGSLPDRWSSSLL